MDQSFILHPAGEIKLQKGGGFTLKLGGRVDFLCPAEDLKCLLLGNCTTGPSHNNTLCN